MDINQVLLAGNVGKDGELRHTQGGLAILEFSVATKESWKDKEDKWQEKTTWHNIKMMGPKAEKYVPAKGDKVIVIGSNDVESWEKDGKKFYKNSVKAHNIMKLANDRKSLEEQTAKVPMIDMTDDNWTPF